MLSRDCSYGCAVPVSCATLQELLGSQKGALLSTATYFNWKVFVPVAHMVCDLLCAFPVRGQLCLTGTSLLSLKEKALCLVLGKTQFVFPAGMYESLCFGYMSPPELCVMCWTYAAEV